MESTTHPSSRSRDNDAPLYAPIPNSAPPASPYYTEDPYSGTPEAGLFARLTRKVGLQRGIFEMFRGKRIMLEKGGESDSDLEENRLLAKKLAFEYQPGKSNSHRRRRYTLLLLGVSLFTFGSFKLYPIRSEFQAPDYDKTTILLSIDSFSPRYLTRGITPHLNAFFDSAFTPAYMTPSFPTVTFANHWTLVTGVYPESHGIVSNEFYDPKYQAHFSYKGQASGDLWWNAVEPIWKTVEKNNLPGGTPMRSAVGGWPGSGPCNGWAVTYDDPYVNRQPLETKVKTIFDWLERPKDKRPHFIAMYVPDVDTAGHKFGPDSPDTNKVIKAADDMVGLLVDGLKKRNLFDIVNFVILSDHGMAYVPDANLIHLESIANLTKVAYDDGWPLHGLRPKAPHTAEELYNDCVESLKDAATKHYKCYYKEDLLPEWNFQKNDRIAPVWVIPEPEYAIIEQKDWPQTGQHFRTPGQHGYDNKNERMRAVFAGRGPAFNAVTGGKKLPLKPFQNVEVYRILAQTLGLKEAAGKNNATYASLDKFPHA